MIVSLFMQNRKLDTSWQVVSEAIFGIDVNIDRIMNLLYFVRNDG